MIGVACVEPLFQVLDHARQVLAAGDLLFDHLEILAVLVAERVAGEDEAGRDGDRIKGGQSGGRILRVGEIVGNE